MNDTSHKQGLPSKPNGLSLRSALERWPWRMRYAFAVTVAAATLFASQALDLTDGGQPIFSLYLLPVALSAFVGGAGPGLAALGVIALGLDGRFFAPAPFAAIAEVFRSERWLALIAVGALVCLLVEALHRALRRTAASERKYRILADHSPNWEFWLGTDNRYQYVSPACREITGHAAEEFVADPYLLERLIHPDDRSRYIEHFQALCAKTERDEVELELRIRTRDGRERWLGHVCSAVTDERGRSLGRRGVNRDITDRKQVEAALRESEARFRIATDSTRDAFILIEGDRGCVKWWNPAAEKVFGYCREEMLGKNLHDYLLPPPLREKAHHGVAHFARTGEGPLIGQTLELMALRKSGEEFPIELSLSAVRLGDKQYAVGIARDITDRRRADGALRAALEEKTALLKEVHHRVKNNLQIITSLLNLQARQVQNSAALAALQDTQDRIRSMALLHESLYRDGRFGKVDGDAYLTHLCTHLRNSFDLMTGRVRLRHHFAPVVLGLEQAVPCGLIVNELVSNAFKHAFPGERGGEIRVELHAEPEGRLALVVADDGVGLPPGLDHRHSDTLGLQLVVGLAQQLGARVDTHAAAGSTFRLSFPAHPSNELSRP